MFASKLSSKYARRVTQSIYQRKIILFEWKGKNLSTKLEKASYLLCRTFSTIGKIGRSTLFVARKIKYLGIVWHAVSSFLTLTLLGFGFFRELSIVNEVEFTERICLFPCACVAAYLKPMFNNVKRF